MQSKIRLAARLFSFLPLSFLLLLALRFSALKVYAADSVSFDIPSPSWPYDYLTDTAQTGMPYKQVIITLPPSPPAGSSLTGACYARYSPSVPTTLVVHSVSAQRVIFRLYLLEDIPLNAGTKYLLNISLTCQQWNSPSTADASGNVSCTIMLPGVSKSRTMKKGEVHNFEFILAPVDNQTLKYIELRCNASDAESLSQVWGVSPCRILEYNEYQGTIDALDLARDEIIDTMTLHLGQVTAAIEQNWDEITGAISTATTSINSELGTQTTTITNSITGSTATLTGAIGDSASLVSGAIGDLQAAEDGFFTRLLNGITSLIVPDEDGMNEILDEFNDFMEDHFGVLYYPIGVTIDIIRLFYNIPVDTDDAKLTFPAIEVMDHELSEEVEVDLNDIVAVGSGNAVISVLHNLYVIYRLIISGAIVITLVLLCWKKMKELRI